MQKCLFEAANFNLPPCRNSRRSASARSSPGLKRYKVTVALKSLLVLLQLLADKLRLQPFAAWLTRHPKGNRRRRQWLGAEQQPGFFEMP